MRQPDDGAGVESGVDGAEAQDLGFGAAGGGSVEIGAGLAQDGVALMPKLASGFIAGKTDFCCGAGPLEGAAQLAGHRG